MLVVIHNNAVHCEHMLRKLFVLHVMDIMTIIIYNTCLFLIHTETQMTAYEAHHT
jgi:hypothetical protein